MTELKSTVSVVRVCKLHDCFRKQNEIIILDALGLYEPGKRYEMGEMTDAIYGRQYVGNTSDFESYWNSKDYLSGASSVMYLPYFIKYFSKVYDDHVRQ